MAPSRRRVSVLLVAAFWLGAAVHQPARATEWAVPQRAVGAVVQAVETPVRVVCQRPVAPRPAAPASDSRRRRSDSRPGWPGWNDGRHGRSDDEHGRSAGWSDGRPGRHIGAGGATAGAGGNAGTTAGRGGTSGTGGASGEADGTGGATAGRGGTAGTGGGTAGTGGSTPVTANAIYAAPNGSATAAGTIDNPTTLAAAVTKVSAGGTIYLRGGKYGLTSTISLSKSWFSSSPINLRAYPLDADRPVLDFTNQASGSRGLSLSGQLLAPLRDRRLQRWRQLPERQRLQQHHRVHDLLRMRGLGPANGRRRGEQRHLNCDSYFNTDASQGNADGFAAKLDVGSGNKFVGCRAWNNSDDGWDGYLRGADNVSTSYENCWAIDNGKLKSGANGSGDGNGFKTGGSDDKSCVTTPPTSGASRPATSTTASTTTATAAA